MEAELDFEHGAGIKMGPWENEKNVWLKYRNDDGDDYDLYRNDVNVILADCCWAQNNHKFSEKIFFGAYKFKRSIKFEEGKI